MSYVLAVGVDNAFVIMTTWNRVHSANKDTSVEERIALTMQHAGVSISITSFSDLVAFACGISTVRYTEGDKSICKLMTLPLTSMHFFRKP